MPGKGSPEFVALMNRCIETHYKKSHDYSKEDNPFSNFERTAIIVSWFNNPVDQVFASLIGIKLARAAELSNGTTPNNESLDDTFMDQTNYSGLWGAWHIKQANAKSEVSKLLDDETLKLHNEVMKDLEEGNTPGKSNIVCNFCGRHFTDIMAIRTRNGNFCGNKCADSFESAKASSKGV